MGGGRRRGGGRGGRPTIEDAVNRLIEAEHNRLDARAELVRFNAEYDRPPPPEEFDNLGQLVEYHNRVQRFESELKKREEAIETAEQSYMQAAEFLRGVLPENVPLHYDYPGRREPMLGNRYVIMNKNGEVITQIEER